MVARPRLARQRVTSRALLLRRVAVGEADLVVTLFTERLGAVSAVARGARRSARRFPALEPVHLLQVVLSLPDGAELGALLEARLDRPRLALVGALDSLDAAGRILRWLRALAPARTAEPALWDEVNRVLDALDQPDAPARAEALLAASGLRLLAAAGWGLELARCVSCERACPSGASVRIDVDAGGVVCRACGGGPLGLRARQRAWMLGAMAGAEEPAGAGDVAAALAVVGQAMAVHGGEGRG
ncbi:MAG: DNA repair protein RecO [Deltaproteobacteria bacterium]|nr:DNA repair protein RecO [Deltaproteobacteria bacterium]